MNELIHITTDAQGASVDNVSYVYIHRRGDNNEPFYVGIGTGPTYKRANHKKSRSELWKRTVAKYGYRIEIVSSEISRLEACELERELIAQYGRRDRGQGLLVNLTDGGESVPIIYSVEYRQQISERHKGNKYNRGRVSSRKGAKLTDETKQKMRLVRQGTKHSEETKQKMRLARRGKPQLGRRGIKFSAEACQRLSLIHKGRPGPNKGKKFSIEVRQKLSASRMGKVGPNRKLVIDLQTGIFYDSVTEAARVLNMHRDTLSLWLRGRCPNKSTFQLC